MSYAKLTYNDTWYKFDRLAEIEEGGVDGGPIDNDNRARIVTSSA